MRRAAALLFGFLPLIISAQVISVDRAELTYDRDFYILGMYNCHEHGLIVSTTDDAHKAERDPDRLYVFYDTNLVETQSVKVEVPFRQKLFGSFEDRYSLYNFHYDMRFGDFTIVCIDPQSADVKKYSGKLPEKLEPGEFVVYDHFAVITNFTRKVTQVLVIDLETSQYTLHEINGKLRHSELSVRDISVFENNEGMGLLMMEKSRRTEELSLLVFNDKGEMENSVTIGDGTYFIVDATSTKLPNGNIAVSGTYNDESGSLSIGVFLAVCNNEKQLFFQTAAFSKLKNFYCYMSERSLSQIERRKERYEMFGKQMDIKELMLIHPAVLAGNTFYIVAEQYEPTYRQITNPTMMSGRPVTTTQRIFDGYEYYSAAVVSFDLSGAFLADYCFPIDLSQKPMILNRIVQVKNIDSTLALAYLTYNIFRSTLISNGKQQDFRIPLQAGMNDRIRYTSGEISAWYGPYFIVSGYQSVKRNDNSELRGKREVYFLQKVLVNN
ncbi:MAG: hypothetical protein GC181_16595 [Bacteroidetes bacterium]|nr:hypothetical protein [Bacteroidota bacterium]